VTVPTIVIAEGTFDDISIERERYSHAANIEIADLSSPENLQQHAVRAQGIVVALHSLSDEHFAAMGPHVRIVGRAGIGLDSIDLAAARQRGVAVLYQPDYATNEVATHAVALLLALNRRLREQDDVARGQWTDRGPLRNIAPIDEYVAGVVGFGRIGRATAERLRPFVAKLVTYDPQASDFPQWIEPAVSLDALLRQSDCLTLHLPLTHETAGLIGERELGLMRPGGLLVNVSRGGLVDETALVRALENGTLGGAGLDVLSQEPPPSDAPILRAPHTLLTPHMAWYSTASESRLKTRTIEGVIAYLRGEPVSSGRLAVDPAPLEAPTTTERPP
jgi:D-3-phosphoglycerate dehydrogenase